MLILKKRFKSACALTAAGAITLAARDAAALAVNQWSNNVGDFSYNTPNNWLHGNVPNSGDQAVMYNGFSQLNATPSSVGALLLASVGSSSALNTQTYKLNILGLADLAGGTLESAGVSSGFSVQAPTMNISAGGELGMLATNAHVHISATSGTATGTLNVDGTSFVEACGVLDVGTYNQSGHLDGVFGNSTINAATFTLNGTSANPATIYPNGHAMTIAATTFELHDPDTKLDLSIANSSLNMSGSIDYVPGYIGANITIGDTSNLSFGDEAIIGYYTKSGAIFVSHGNVALNGGPTLARAAQISSYSIFFTTVNVTGYGKLPAAEFDGGSTTTVAASSFLYLNSPYFRGTPTNTTAYFSGPGTINMNGDTAIGYPDTSLPYSTLNVQAGTVFDWDGTSDKTATCTITNGELDIYSSTIDVQQYFLGIPINNFGYDGALSVTNGKLNVAGTAWTLFGTMTLGPGAVVQGQTLTIDGSSLAAGTYSVVPTYNGSNFPTIQSSVVIKPSSVIYMASGGGLHLDGPTNWAGGSVISAPYVSGTQPYGILIQNGNATVTANTNIFCDVLDMDGSANTATWTINAGITFTQQAFFLDTLNSTTNPFHSSMTLNGGTINMQTNSGLWTLAGGVLNMNSVGFAFPYVEHDKLVLGSGATIGTVNVGASSIGFINAPLQSAATSVVGGNVLNVGTGSFLVVNAFGSDANAVTTKTGGGDLSIGGAQTHAAGSKFLMTQGILDLTTDAGAGGANLALNVSGGGVNLKTTQRLSSLTVGAGSTVVVTPIASPGPRSVVVSTLSMTGGTLDVTTNDLICKTGNLTTITANIATGFNNGTWTGVGGITSSSAATDTSHTHAVGVLLNKSPSNTPIFPTFDGQPSVITDVLVKYTWFGDANLDGKVDGSDYSLTDAGYLSPVTLTGWSHGDFNYDGKIDGGDYSLLDNAYNRQGAQLTSAALVASPAAGIAAVPEPAGMALLGLCLLVARRRR